MSRRNIKLPLPPPDTRYVEHQAGGHCCCNGDDVLPNLQHKDGWFLKVLRDSPRYWHEVEFYMKVFDPDCQDEDIVALRRLVPKFDGIFQTVFDGKDTKYITLEDLTHKHQFPCILDIKMKADVHDPNSCNSHSVPELSIKMGFLLDGLEVYDMQTQMYHSYKKMFGRNLNEEKVKNDGEEISSELTSVLMTNYIAHWESFLHELLLVLHQFINGYQGVKSKEVLKSILQRLHSVREWAVSQQKFKFYRSSLLLVYDAAFLLTSLSSYESADNVTSVRMVDFAKFQETTETDYLYVQALDNLIDCFIKLL